MFLLQQFSVATNEEIFVDIANGLIVFKVYFRQPVNLCWIYVNG